MTKKLLFLLPLLLSLVFTACHKDEDELLADVVLTFTGEDMTVQRMQGTVTLTRLDSRQVFTSAEFIGNTATSQVLRGAYSVLVEGSVQYVDGSGSTQTRQFRASTDYADLSKAGGNELTLEIILM